MYRTRADKLHPANKVVASGLSSYLSEGDPAGVLRFIVESPLDSLWNGVFTNPLFGQFCIVKRYSFTDVRDIDMTNQWEQNKDDQGALVPALLAGHGGGLRLASGNTQFLSYNFLTEKNKLYEFTDSRKTWLMFEAKVADTVDSNANVSYLEIGFGSDLDGNAIHISGPDSGFSYYALNTGQDVRRFSSFHSTGETSVYTVSVEESDADYVDLRDGEWHRIGIRIEPMEEEPGNYSVYIFEDNKLVQQIASVPIDENVPMALWFGTISHNDLVDIREIIVVQDKD